jgi:(E)-4-hydroxy-3-methylbut-2-enyl-diphosphate synthase
MIFEMSFPVRLHKTVGVRVGRVQVGGGAPVAVQSMTLTETADAAATARQCVELAEAGSELVRITVNTPKPRRGAGHQAADARRRREAPLIGDFHYNGHLLLTRFPEAARPSTNIASIPATSEPAGGGRAVHHDLQGRRRTPAPRPHRRQRRVAQSELVVSKMQENSDQDLGRSSEEIINECMVLSALQSTDLALDAGLRKDQIIISCKVSRPRDLIAIYRDLARRTDQPLHLGLTEAGMGIKGIAWSASAVAVLLSEGIGDTLRVSLTPRPGGDRRDEVYAACEILQALGLRSFSPSITACPGCGRTTS